jgi:excisionase family DNA binding protein
MTAKTQAGGESSKRPRPKPEELAFLTAAEAAELLRVRQSKVLAWLRSGELRGFDLSERPGRGNARWKIARTDLDEFLQSRQPRPTPKQSSQRRRKAANPPGWIEFIK